MLTPLYRALCEARLAHPGYYLPVTHYSPRVAISAGMPFGAFVLAMHDHYTAALKGKA